MRSNNIIIYKNRFNIGFFFNLCVSFVPKFGNKFGCILIFINDKQIFFVMQSYGVPLGFPLFNTYYYNALYLFFTIKKCYLIFFNKLYPTMHQFCYTNYIDNPHMLRFNVTLWTGLSYGVPLHLMYAWSSHKWSEVICLMCLLLVKCQYNILNKLL